MLLLLHRLFQKLFHHADIIGVAGALSGHLPSYRFVQQIKISYEIQNLVSGKFIGKPEFGVNHLLIIHQDDIIDPSSFSQSQTITSISISFRKPKVLAGAIFFLNSSVLSRTK